MKTPMLLSLSFSSFCLWLLFVSSLCTICFCNQSSNHVLCLPVERSALLDLKNNLTDPANRLSSWRGKDCCTWFGVVCHNFTGHVHEIHLRGPDDGVHGHCNRYNESDTSDEIGEALTHMLGGTISPSVIRLLQLKYLDLSCNDFQYSSIPAFIGSFQNLMYLNISKSNFGGGIPRQLGNLSTVSVLDLHDDPFSFNLHSKSLKWLTNLKGLRYLDMGGIDLEKALDWFPVISNLTSLLELHLSGCGLISLPSDHPTTVSFTSLNVLDLSLNIFESMFEWIFRLRDLALLDLTACFISNVSHDATHGGFRSMPSLRILLLSSNTFVNSFFLLNGFSSLSNLRLLDVSDCDISSPILGTLRNLSFIEYLDLSGNQIDEEIPKSLSNLCNFTTLNLQSNNFSGNVSELLERFCECDSPKLESLALGENHLIGQLPKRLGILKNLVHIDFVLNQLTGSIPDSIRKLKSLVTFNLALNQLTGNIPNSLRKLKNLVSIDLRNNQLTGTIPDSLGKLRNLKSIDLRGNQLRGTIPDSLGSLPLLQILQISFNKLSGSIPDTVSGLSLLEFLDLSYNTLNGSLPESIGRLGKLSTLDLSHNSLTGIVTESHFVDLTALNTLRVQGNKLVFKLNADNWIPPFNLSVLSLGSCSLGPQFPSWIRSQTNLRELDVSNTNMSDNWSWTTFSSLELLNISHNNFRGKLGDVSFLAPGAVLDLSNNHLHGVLPSNFNRADLDFLDLSNNNLSGTLQNFLCSGIHEPRKLRYFNLASNNMSGVIPDCWLNWKSLVILNLEKNQLSGVIPLSIRNLSSLRSIDMGDNRLSGNLPAWFLNSNSLVVIKLAENELTGKIPPSIERDSTSLRVLSLRSNKFEGKIPDEICHLRSVQILDLAHNDLSGNLPTCFTNFSVISGSEASSPIVLYETLVTETMAPEVMIEASLETKGSTYRYSTILFLVTLLDLSNNKLTGSIPDEVVGLLGLRFLNLAHNDLTGTIPNSFRRYGQLESLDLSMNHLNGNIPSTLSELTALNWLNVSYNNLEGRIPTGPQIQTFGESSFMGNKLCGDPLAACLRINDETKESTDEDNGIDWILVISSFAGLVVGFWIMVIPLILSKRWRFAYYHFLEEIWFKLQDFILVLFPCHTKRSMSG